MSQARRAATGTRANGEITREKILDAAERLFGQKGFDVVSLREITEAAGVTLALAHYHFQTKENLFAQAVARRADILGALRRQRLDALRGAGSLDVRSLLDAFMQPIFEFMQNGDEGWSSYVTLLTRLGEDRRWLDLVSQHFDEVAREYLNELVQLLPEAKADRLSRGFTFVILLMLQTVSSNRRLDSLTGRASAANDLRSAYAALLPFCEAGILRVAEA